MFDVWTFLNLILSSNYLYYFTSFLMFSKNKSYVRDFVFTVWAFRSRAADCRDPVIDAALTCDPILIMPLCIV